MEKGTFWPLSVKNFPQDRNFPVKEFEIDPNVHLEKLQRIKPDSCQCQCDQSKAFSLFLGWKSSRLDIKMATCEF